MGLSEGLKWYYDLCGTRGVCAAACFRLFRRPREFAATPPGCNRPVYLRWNTSDFCAYKDVLVSQDKRYDPGPLAPGPGVIVDAGAHIGMASILFAQKYPAAKIIALEPEPSNFSALVRNAFPYPAIVPMQAALWHEDGEVTLGPSGAHPNGAFQVDGTGNIRARAVTMPTLMREKGIETIDLLKVDIEGAEKEVFAVCPWVDRVGAIAIELHDRIKPGCASTVESALWNFRQLRQGDVAIFLQNPHQ